MFKLISASSVTHKKRRKKKKEKEKPSKERAQEQAEKQRILHRPLWAFWDGLAMAS